MDDDIQWKIVNVQRHGMHKQTMAYYYNMNKCKIKVRGSSHTGDAIGGTKLAITAKTIGVFFHSIYIV